MKFKIAKKVSSVFIILAVAAIAEFVNNIMLGRNLSPEIFGRFKFINTVILMLASLLVFGQNMTIIRVFTEDIFGKYNWKKFIRNCLVIASIVGAVSCVVIAIFYKLRFELVFAFIAIIAAVGTDYFSALLRSREKYIYSIFISKTVSICFFFVLIFMFTLMREVGLFNLLFVYSAMFIIALFLGFHSIRKLPVGTESLPRKTIKEGLLLFLISFSFLVMSRIDQFFIARMLSYEELANYVVVITVTRGF